MTGIATSAATQSCEPEPEIAANDIGGTVTSRFGPEAGVWVIAETRDLGTRFAKIVVTDDYALNVIPRLPAAHYQIWVRGYGLVDLKEGSGGTWKYPGPQRHDRTECGGRGSVLSRRSTGSRC